MNRAAACNHAGALSPPTHPELPPPPGNARAWLHGQGNGIVTGQTRSNPKLSQNFEKGPIMSITGVPRQGVVGGSRSRLGRRLDWPRTCRLPSPMPQQASIYHQRPLACMVGAPNGVERAWKAPAGVGKGSLLCPRTMSSASASQTSRPIRYRLADATTAMVRSATTTLGRFHDTTISAGMTALTPLLAARTERSGTLASPDLDRASPSALASIVPAIDE